MASTWDWPGSRWWRVDLHAHSPASYDFGTAADRENPAWMNWLDKALNAELQAIALTDHNTSRGISPIQGVSR